MRKFLLLLALCLSYMTLNAQTTVWSDDFDDEDVSDWTLIDSDGDGFLWNAAQLVDGDTGEPIGTPILTSVSWSGFPLTPDNWAISPAIDLTGVTGEISLNWWVFASDPLYNQENYGVYVSTTNTAAGMIAAGELFTEFDIPAELEERTLDLSAFAGQTVYVGFRHYDVTDQFRLGIDDVSVVAGGGDPAEGCLEADNGQYPSATFVPSCNGDAETITSAGWTGEYSLVTVTSGEEYIFSVSDPTYFITIGNEAGDAVITSGTGSVTWTADISGNVRFYTHFTSACDFDASTFLTRSIQCGEPPVEPDYGCDQSYDGTYYLANSVSSDLGYTVANDFFAPGDADSYVINSVTAALLPIAGSDADFSTFDVSIHSDNAGTPGAVLETFAGLTATSVTLRSELFAGYNNYDVTLTIPDYEVPVTAGTDTRYWVSIAAASASAQNIFWIGYPHTTGWVTATNYQSADGGTTWEQIIDENTPGMFFDSIWSIDATCEGGSTGEPCGEEVESNNLENGLFLGGADNQRLAVDIVVDANTEFTLETVEPTIIIPEGGAATSFSFIFYEDLGGLPGAELGQSTGTIVSSTVTGQNFGRDFIRYEVSLATPMVMEAGTYWMEMESDAEGWEATTASVIGSTLVFSNASTTDEWVVDGTGTELVYELIGTCTTLGVSDMDAFDFAYYPNPVKDELNITSQKLVQSVSVYNLAGQQVSAQKLNAVNGKISTSSLAPGVYVFRAVLEGGQVETFKIIKK